MKNLLLLFCDAKVGIIIGIAINSLEICDRKGCLFDICQMRKAEGQ